MSTCTLRLQVILFPEDGHLPHLVPLLFKLSEIEAEDGPPGIFPRSIVQDDLDRVLGATGKSFQNLMDREYHIISPSLASIDSDQVYLMYWTTGGNRVNLSLSNFTEGRADPGLTHNIIVIKQSPIWDVWQDADLEVDLPILKRYLSWFPGC